MLHRAVRLAPQRKKGFGDVADTPASRTLAAWPPEAWTRLAALWTGSTERRQLQLAAGAIVFATVALLAVLLLPGETYVAIYINDMFIFFDGADRVLRGQVPNRDFHTPLGPLAFLLPALGLWSSGTLGGMMPVATAAFALLLLPMLIHVCASRLPPLYALMFAAYVMLLVIAPQNIGEPHITFAMFYNRWGLAALSLLFLLVLPRRRTTGSAFLDVATAATLVLVMFYLKISFAAVGLAFVMALIAIRHMRWSALATLLVAGGAAILIELVWSGTATYRDDIRQALAASGTIRGGLWGLIKQAFDNLPALFLLGTVIVIALLRRARWEYLLLSLYMAGSGVLLALQNAQYAGLPTLIPAAVVAALAPTRGQSARAPFAPQVTNTLLVAALALPATMTAAFALALHLISAMGAAPSGPNQARMDGLITDESALQELPDPGVDAMRAAYRTGSGDLRTINMLRQRNFRQPLAQPEYVWMLEEGMTLLRSDSRLSGKVFVLDMANPFNALLNREPPRNTDAWYHANRSFSAAAHRPAASILADVDVVLAPKSPIDLRTAQLMDRLFAGAIARNFELVGTSLYWEAFARKR